MAFSKRPRGRKRIRPRKDIINVTAHTIRLMSPDGTRYEVPPSGIVVMGKLDITPFKNIGWTHIVHQRYVATPEGTASLDRLEKMYPNHLVIGSIVAAQAYPGRVFSMVPAEGYERTKFDSRVMSDSVFVSYEVEDEKKGDRND